jgi:hypothetical protein
MRIRLATCLSTATLLLVLIANAHATPLAPSKASDTITVAGSTSSPTCTSGYQLDAQENGDGSTTPFVQPPKSAFVVTSFDFIFQNGPTSKNIFVALFVKNPLAGTSLVSVVPSLADSAGLGGGTVTLPSGFAVKPGMRLCFQFLGAANGSMTAHGFLAKDK